MIGTSTLTKQAIFSASSTSLLVPQTSSKISPALFASVLLWVRILCSPSWFLNLIASSTVKYGEGSSVPFAENSTGNPYPKRLPIIVGRMFDRWIERFMKTIAKGRGVYIHLCMLDMYMSASMSFRSTTICPMAYAPSHSARHLCFLHNPTSSFTGRIREGTEDTWSKMNPERLLHEPSTSSMWAIIAGKSFSRAAVSLI